MAACGLPLIEKIIDLSVFIPGEAEKVIEKACIESKHLVDEGVVLFDFYVRAGEIP